MGGSSSVPSELTHEKLYELTGDTRAVMDKLLDYTTKKISMNDFLQLSNPEGCKKYVLFLTNSLHKLFYELQVAPSTDRRGVIFFRSIKDLGQPTQQEQVERQSLCLTLAYFYTRIFQIYGALALTLIDDISYTSKTGVLDFVTNQSRLRAPGYQPTAYYGFAQTGGAFSLSNMGKFSFLKGYLLEQTYGDKGYRTRYVGDGDSRGTVYFTANINGELETNTNDGTFSIAYMGAKDFVELPVTITENGIGSLQYVLTFKKLKYVRKGELEERMEELPIAIRKPIIFSAQPSNTGTAMIYRITGTSTPLFDYLKRFFSIVVPFSKKLVEGAKTETEATGAISDTEIPEHLKLRRIIENLNRVKPFGHCIARGLQLLRSVPFKDEPNMSYICKPTFLEKTHMTKEGVKTTASRSGIPEPGSKLRESPGISALAQLFYDTILLGNHQLQIGTTPGPSGKSTRDQYLEFITVMSRLFGDKKMMDADPDTKLRDGVMEVQDVRDRELCKSLPSDVSREQLSVSNPVAREVYQHVAQLFRRQLSHAKECGKIFQRLFSIQKDQRTGIVQIALSQNIIQGGFPEINRINHDARELLINYYKDCETGYLHGMKIVIDSKLKEKTESDAVKQKAAMAAMAAKKVVQETSESAALARRAQQAANKNARLKLSTV